MSISKARLAGGLLLILVPLFSVPVHAQIGANGGLDSTSNTLPLSVNGQQAMTLNADTSGANPPNPTIVIPSVSNAINAQTGAINAQTTAISTAITNAAATIADAIMKISVVGGGGTIPLTVPGSVNCNVGNPGQNPFTVPYVSFINGVYKYTGGFGGGP